MKKVSISLTVFFSVFVLFSTPLCKAQGIYQLWGSTVYGGSDNKGVLFSSKSDASGYNVKKQFTVSKTGHPYTFNKPLVFNNKLYSILSDGGLGDDGIIGEYDPASDTWQKKADLFSIGARKSQSALILYNNKMYGVTSNGGINGEGTIFEFNPVNNGLVKLHDFTSATGSYPMKSMVVYNNKFYGTTKKGGINDDGVLYEFNPATNTYSREVNFNSATSGRESASSLTVYNGALWGTTTFGALMEGGSLFTYDPDTDIFLKKKDFKSLGIGFHTGALTLLNNKFYGATVTGGVNAKGVIFQYDPVIDILTIEYSFTATSARDNIEFTVLNNKLYSCSSYGGLYNEGVIFSYDPLTNIYDALMNIGGALGSMGGGCMTLFNGNFFGFTTYGGYNNKGTLFYYNPVENGYVSVVHFGGKEFQSPTGPLLYHNDRIYGTVSEGGNNLEGGIYEFNPATGAFNINLHMADLTGRTGFDQGGFILYNNKFYGITIGGGINNYGTFFEYDPATNIYTKKYDFDFATGSHPRGTLSVYNGKFYGMCSSGSTNGAGNIYEFDITTNTYTQKVILNNLTGTLPHGKLTLYNNKFYGMCSFGGTNGNGTLFEYDPTNNIFTKKYDFDFVNGKSPYGGVTAYNNKLYGFTYLGGSSDLGVIFEYDPANSVFTKKTDLNNTTGGNPLSNLTLLNKKLYGITNDGGANGVGTTIEFDPLTGICIKKADLSVPNGKTAAANDLSPVPALVAPGSPNSCINTQTININAANANQWIPFTDTEGRAVAEINANGNILGNTMVRVFVNAGNIRQNSEGVFYLDRNITITPANQPLSPVSVRLYIRKKEFDDLKATNGSGITSPSDLTVYKNDDFCSNGMSVPALKLSSVHSNWTNDYVYTTDVSTFSSFYFANKNVVLPVHLLSFSGKKEEVNNLLQWTATCTNGVNFTIERSTDGINFNSIGIVLASPLNCNKPFIFPDQSPPPGKTFYRLQVKEDNGPVYYSQVITIERSSLPIAGLKILPNPVTGSVANAKVTASKNATASFTILDVNGRQVKNIIQKVMPGINTVNLQVENLPAGVYILLYNDGINKMNTRLIKQ